MLVLSRKAGERISIGPEIELTVLDIHKGRVKLGFLGPLEVPIHREELLRRIGPDQSSHPTVRLQEARDSKGK
jgi:carbon storage regulator